MTITTTHPAGARHDGAVTNHTDPDPEVPERARAARRFQAAYKARILAEYEHLSKAQKGALLRREGLYASLLSEWRRQADAGAHEALGRPAGRPAADSRDREIAKLRRDKERLTGGSHHGPQGDRGPGKALGAVGAARHRQRDGQDRRDEVIDQAIGELAPVVGTKEACRVLGEARARYYRRHRQSPAPPRPPRVPAPQPRALSDDERASLREVLNGEAHVDEAPATIYAKLLDEGRYLASVSTMYRVLHAHTEVKERRRHATHPATKKPELLATAPNEVWSWDITKLAGPVKWSYFYLYVVLDIYSRYVPGWMLARAENATLAKALLTETIAKHGIAEHQLTLHSDRGSPMTAKPFVFLMADLGVTRSYSRPHTSNDNPYSESHFRTAKYRPDFPDRFGSYEDAHAWCSRFFRWYNDEHRHSGIGYHTPADVHFGRAEAVRDQRALVLDAAYAAHPERFVRKPPAPPTLPAVAWINRPPEVTTTIQ